MGQSKIKLHRLPGLNIQWPWSRLILSGDKTVETRNYRVPEKYLNTWLAIIETPGPSKDKPGRPATARIVGLIRFANCYPYKNRKHWLSERSKHIVGPNDEAYAFKADSKKWAWVIEEVRSLEIPQPAPLRRGIIFAQTCDVHL